MTMTGVLTRKLRTMVRFLMLGVLFTIGMQMVLADEDSMEKKDFQVSVNAQHVEFTKPAIFKDGAWLVPLAPLAKQLELKVEYPEGAEMVVLCGGVESELCVPLRFQDGKEGAVDIDGITYVQPAHLAKTFGFEIYKASANTLEIIQSASLAPEFTLPDLADTPRRLRDFRGKKTFLYVWGSW